MKNLRDFLWLALTATIFCYTILSCNKEEDAPTEAQTNQTNATNSSNEGEEGELTFRSMGADEFDNYLNTAALGLLELSKNSAFRSLVNTEVGKKFDGDDNALLKTGSPCKRQTKRPNRNKFGWGVFP